MRTSEVFFPFLKRDVERRTYSKHICFGVLAKYLPRFEYGVILLLDQLQTKTGLFYK